MPLYTIRTGAPLHPEDTVLQHLTDMVRKGGVLDPATDFLTVEPSGGGLNVDVGTGRGYMKKDGNTYPLRNTATQTVSIGANSSGNPRIDSIVAYLDLTIIPNATTSQGDDVCSIVAVQGTPAASPVAPLEAQIESAIGASNPYIILDNVTVANGASGISNANIARACDRVFMKTPKPTFDLPYSATVTPDYLDGDQQKIDLTGNVTVNAPTNMVIGDYLMLKLVQDGTGGRTVTWFAGITWLSADYSINSTADKVSVYAFKKTGTSSYEGYLVGKEY